VIELLLLPKIRAECSGLVGQAIRVSTLEHLTKWKITAPMFFRDLIVQKVRLNASSIVVDVAEILEDGTQVCTVLADGTVWVQASMAKNARMYEEYRRVRIVDRYRDDDYEEVEVGVITIPIQAEFDAIANEDFGTVASTMFTAARDRTPPRRR